MSQESQYQIIIKELKQLSPNTQLLAVSKLQEIKKIENLFNLGQKTFAENYVQEALEKQAQLSHLNIDWHFIGSIQSNKSKKLVGNFSLIHSVDSLKICETFNKVAQENEIQQRILLQINLAEEATKGGISKSEIANYLEQSKKWKNLEIVGFMTMPPLFDNPEDARPYFRELRNILFSFQKNYPQLRDLSMGTSSDYRVAAEEGATWVRLGTLLFGERPKK